MGKNIIFLLLSIFIIVSCSVSKKLAYSKLKVNLTKCIEEDLLKDERICKYNKTEKSDQIKYYNNELKFYPLSKSIDKVLDFHRNNKLSNFDTIGFIFYYPFVGFDPQNGYVFSYEIHGPSKGMVIWGGYDFEEGKFEERFINRDELLNRLEYYENLENGCGDGYLIYYKTSINDRFRECNCVYGIEF